MHIKQTGSKLKSALLTLGSCLFWVMVFAQPLKNEARLSINNYSNEIGNKELLTPLFQRLNKCNEPSCLLSVLHLGDSHIKSKFYSRAMESQLNILFNQVGHVYRVNDSTTGRKTYFFNLEEYAVIGTRFENYYDSPLLMNYLVANQPDLVIVSLGTNDAYSGIAIDEMNAQMKALIQLIRTNSPKSLLLFTTPPDELKYIPSRDGADRLELVRQNIMQNCITDSIPYWNLYSVMGGKGQMRNWQRWGFAGMDNVHYTANGYTLFGRLLAEAIFDGYKHMSTL
ncbi:MAG: GDSL-type esterase/lipase family protein [Chitinophagaceae bacterium]